ncbi:LysR family transcriptional regulator [Sinorhizobium medicae]
MELRDLQYFEVIATTGHIGRAAEKLGRTQPALSKSVRRIESEIGTKLLVKSGRGVALTTAGRVMLERARSLRMSVEQNLREMADIAKGAAGNVRVGSGATTAEYLLPLVCSRILREAPGIKFEISIGMNDVLRTALNDGKVDIVVGPVTKGDESNYTVHRLGEDSVVVAAARGHPLTRKKATIADLQDYGWVLPARSVVTRQWIDAAFASRDLSEPDVAIQTNNISLSPRLIAPTDLLTFISRRNLGRGRVGEPLVEISLPETTMHREVVAVHRNSSYMPPAVERFIAILKQEAGPALEAIPEFELS